MLGYKGNPAADRVRNPVNHERHGSVETHQLRSSAGATDSGPTPLELEEAKDRRGGSRVLQRVQSQESIGSPRHREAPPELVVPGLFRTMAPGPSMSRRGAQMRERGTGSPFTPTQSFGAPTSPRDRLERIRGERPEHLTRSMSDRDFAEAKARLSEAGKTNSVVMKRGEGLEETFGTTGRKQLDDIEMGGPSVSTGSFKGEDPPSTSKRGKERGKEARKEKPELHPQGGERGETDSSGLLTDESDLDSGKGMIKRTQSTGTIPSEKTHKDGRVKKENSLTLFSETDKERKRETDAVEEGQGSEGGRNSLPSSEPSPEPGQAFAALQKDKQPPKKIVLMQKREMLKFGILTGFGTIQADLEKYMQYFMLAFASPGCDYIATYSQWILIASIAGLPFLFISAYLTDNFSKRQNIVYIVCCFLQMAFLIACIFFTRYDYLILANICYQIRTLAYSQGCMSVWKLFKLRLDKELDTYRKKQLIVESIKSARSTQTSSEDYKELVATTARLVWDKTNSPGLDASTDPSLGSETDSEQKAEIKAVTEELYEYGDDLPELEDIMLDGENIIISSVGTLGEIFGNVFESLILVIVFVVLFKYTNAMIVTYTMITVVTVFNVIIFLLSLTIRSKDLKDLNDIVIDENGNETHERRHRHKKSKGEKGKSKKTGKDNGFKLTKKDIIGRFKYMFQTPAIRGIMFHVIILGLTYLLLSYPITIFINMETGDSSSGALSQSLSTSSTEFNGPVRDVCSGTLYNLVEQSIPVNIGYVICSILYLLFLVRCPPRYYYPFAEPVLSIISISILICVMFLRSTMPRLVLIILIAIVQLLPYYMKSFSDYAFSTAINSEFYGFVISSVSLFNQIITIAVDSVLYSQVDVTYLVWVSLAFFALLLVHGFIISRIFRDPLWAEKSAIFEDKTHDSPVVSEDNSDFDDAVELPVIVDDF